MDTLTPQRRSWNMSRIRGRDTGPERAVADAVRSLRFKFEAHDRTLPGRPDFVLPRRQAVILVHGCFWHRHRNCRSCYSPKTNVRFWRAKFEQNVARDRRDARRLRAAGYKVVVVWECQTGDQARLRSRLKKRLSGPGRSSSVR